MPARSTGPTPERLDGGALADTADDDGAPPVAGVDDAPQVLVAKVAVAAPGENGVGLVDEEGGLTGLEEPEQGCARHAGSQLAAPGEELEEFKQPGFA
jgi:hypothetical protein